MRRSVPIFFSGGDISLEKRRKMQREAVCLVNKRDFRFGNILLS